MHVCKTEIGLHPKHFSNLLRSHPCFGSRAHPSLAAVKYISPVSINYTSSIVEHLRADNELEIVDMHHVSSSQ